MILVQDMEWIKIDKFGYMPEPPFFLTDETGFVYVGNTAFDYYDSVYWFPMPNYPMSEGIITNDEWVSLIFKREKQ